MSLSQIRGIFSLNNFNWTIKLKFPLAYESNFINNISSPFYSEICDFICKGYHVNKTSKKIHNRIVIVNWLDPNNVYHVDSGKRKSGITRDTENAFT